jgi:hypothetical protein
MNDDFDAAEVLFQCGDYTKMRLWCDRMALSSNAVLQAASVAGSHTAITAFLGGALANNTKFSMSARELEFNPWVYAGDAYRNECGYRVQRKRLGPHTWQAFVVTKDPTFVLSVSPAAVWSRLKSNDFTTPLLWDWLPYVEQELRSRELLTNAPSFRMNAGQLTVRPEHLDAIVCEGIKAGKLSIERKCA